MTVYVESDKTEDSIDVANVTAVDLRDGKNEIESEDGLTVAAQETETTNPHLMGIWISTDLSTAGDALYSLAEATGLSFTQNDGYVQSITTMMEKHMLHIAIQVELLWMELLCSSRR